MVGTGSLECKLGVENKAQMNKGVFLTNLLLCVLFSELLSAPLSTFDTVLTCFSAIH